MTTVLVTRVFLLRLGTQSKRSRESKEDPVMEILKHWHSGRGPSGVPLRWPVAPLEASLPPMLAVAAIANERTHI